MATPPAPTRIDWAPRAAVLLAGITSVVAVLLRQSGVPRYRTVWAEDGQVFGQCAFTDPSPVTCLVQGYDGWLHVVPRLLALAASLMPPALFSYAITLAAALATGAAAMLLARAVVHATRQPAPAMLAGASVALVLPAGLEVGGNVANLHWILFVASATVICCGVIGHRVDRWDAALVLLTAASSPFGLLLFVLLAGASVAAEDGARVGRALALATLAISTVQLAALFGSPRNELPDAVVTLLSPIGWLLDQLYRRGPFGGRGVVPGWFIGTYATLAFAALVVVTARAPEAVVTERGPERSRWARWRGPTALVALGGSCAAAFAASTYLNRHDTPRYDLIPAVGLVTITVLVTSMLGAAVGRVRLAWATGRERPLPMGVTASAIVSVVLVAGFATTFRVASGASNGPSYPAAYRAAAGACTAGAAQARIQISPLPKGSVSSTWHLAIPCTRIRT